MTRTALCLAFLVTLPSIATAQWPARPMSGVPRTADGKVNLTAPAPRTSRGTPDLSGLWAPEPDPKGKPEGVENAIFPRYLLNVMQDAKEANALLLPAAESLQRQRFADNSAADPIAHCQPPGAGRIFSFPRPTKIIETPGVTLLLHETDTSFRQVFTDGRPLPEDPFPTWMGYSIGRWEQDTFVVTTIGLTERSWLDMVGHPHTEKLVLTERFHRVDVGHMDLEITYTDPATFKTPFTVTQKLRLLPDQELIEYFCSDNEKSREHYTTK